MVEIPGLVQKRAGIEPWSIGWLRSDVVEKPTHYSIEAVLFPRLDECTQRHRLSGLVRIGWPELLGEFPLNVRAGLDGFEREQFARLHPLDLGHNVRQRAPAHLPHAVGDDAHQAATG